MKTVINIAKETTFALSTKAIIYYLKLKGKDCYFYINRCDINLCKKVDLNYEYIDIAFPFIKDFGESFDKRYWEEYKKYWFNDNKIDKSDPDLIKTIEYLGKDANGFHSKLVIKEII